eukprot:scaffold56984_cov39-Attheya_sp.AAC.1
MSKSVTQIGRAFCQDGDSRRRNPTPPRPYSCGWLRHEFARGAQFPLRLPWDCCHVRPPKNPTRVLEQRKKTREYESGKIWQTAIGQKTIFLVVPNDSKDQYFGVYSIQQRVTGGARDQVDIVAPLSRYQIPQ